MSCNAINLKESVSIGTPETSTNPKNKVLENRDLVLNISSFLTPEDRTKFLTVNKLLYSVLKSNLKNRVLESEDLALKISSFLTPEDRIKFLTVNKQLCSYISPKVVTESYLEKFGQLSPQFNIEATSQKVVKRCLEFANMQPDIGVNHNTHKAPEGILERWKWMLGFENALDSKVQDSYDKSIQLLGETQSTSIIQLKNKLVAYWHLDCEMKNYRSFKIEHQEKAKSGRIRELFFWCVEKVFERICKYNRVNLQTGPSLYDRSLETYAKIGKFTQGNKHYTVAAFQVLTDENTDLGYIAPNNPTSRYFRLVGDGYTNIGIFPQGVTPSYRGNLGHFGFRHSLGICLARDEARPRFFYSLTTGEFDASNENIEVFDSDRTLMVGNHLEYRDGGGDQGSNRLLDQKLTQIMVEMARQNKSIKQVEVDSVHDDLPVLVAGGFKSTSHHRHDVLQEVLNYRRQSENNSLFPPYENYSGVQTCFDTRTLSAPNVYFQREGGPQTWNDIIRESPILNPGSGVLPEYWVDKPNIVERPAVNPSQVDLDEDDLELEEVD